MDKSERNPAAGAALGGLSAAKNKKILAVVGAALFVIGIAGIIAVGARGIDIVTSGGFASPEQGKAIQSTEYIFLFTMLAGLILIIYSLVGIQRDKSKARQSHQANSRRNNADAA